MRCFFANQILSSTMFVLLISGCSLSGQRLPPTVLPEFNQMILLTDNPCTEPCWQVLKIGKSTESETMAVISSLKFIDQKTIRVIPQSVPDSSFESWVEGKEVVATCINRKNVCLRLTIANEILRDVYAELDYGLTLEMAVRHFGGPDYIGYQNIGGDVIDCKTELIWIKEQLVLYSEVFSKREDVNDNCFAVNSSGLAMGSLTIAEANYIPLAEINIRIEKGQRNDQLTEYIGLK